ncbi:YdeI/OmpD-associated family protein [Lactobacillus acetotolerans]|uniref:YdeI/OmpD-associated family protein n=1 Tax=Lactobacillus acetotolerans TaxID=1600 RepID=UPI00145125F3|nr:YdeI/OmpD-associated family protein [Lactobacillus acetotolerans]QJD72737.1 YdeI/OmpD-associated family protein [Lactobacillus acetotolerans]
MTFLFKFYLCCTSILNQGLKNFESFPELYKRVRIDTIQIKRNRPQLFQKRLSRFLKNTKEGKMYGRWNDQGRLLNY